MIKFYDKMHETFYYDKQNMKIFYDKMNNVS